MALLRYGVFNLRTGNLGGADFRCHLEYSKWHLDFLCNTNPDYTQPKGGAFPYDCRNVDIYLLSTGIRFDHTSFTGRAVPLPGYTDNLTPVGVQNGYDVLGEGTDVALLCAGALSGIAKASSVFSARVLRDNLTLDEDLFSLAVDRILANVQSRPNQCPVVLFPYVRIPKLNSYLVQSIETLSERKIKELRNKNIPVFVPAGDGFKDGDTSLSYLNSSAAYPARLAEVFTVGSCDREGQITKNSCYGSSINFYVPGENLVVEEFDPKVFKTVSGTKYACGLACGLAAQYFHKYPKKGFSEFSDYYKKYFRKNIVENYPEKHMGEDVALTPTDNFYNGIPFVYEDRYPFVYYEELDKTTYVGYSFFRRGYLVINSGEYLGSFRAGVDFNTTLSAVSNDIYMNTRKVYWFLKTPLPSGLFLGQKTGKIFGRIDESFPVGDFYFTVGASDGTYTDTKSFFININSALEPKLVGVAGKTIHTRREWLLLDIKRKPNAVVKLDIPKNNNPPFVKFPDRRKVVILNKDSGVFIGSVWSSKQTGEFYFPTGPGNFQLVVKNPLAENSAVIDKTVS